LLWATGRAVAGTGLLLLVLFTLYRVHRVVARRLLSAAEAGLERTGVGKDTELGRTSWLFDLVRRIARLFALGLCLLAIYTWLTFVLQQFPITRPWGEALGGYLLATVKRLGWSAVTAMPGLFTVVLIFLVTRIVVRIATLLFDAIQQGRLPVAGLHGPRVTTTRRLVTTLLWLFAVVVAYPYLPGSNTDAFKGVSVFVGLVVSLGSTGVVNQLMSGFMLTYSDAIAPGEYVRVGEIEGTVTSLGVLSTKIRTLANEEITLPNAVVISGTTTNYSRHAAEGVFAGTTVTIGYDAPWRQVEALLLLAASRTPGLRADRPPFVLQTGLGDFYVEYRLVVCVAEPRTRVRTLAALHAQIQDAFNEHGVQIMSPHYEQDPEGAKVVPRARWYDAPAKAPESSPAERSVIATPRAHADR
jgi:small-conductance mechanosensitive channel